MLIIPVVSLNNDLSAKIFILTIHTISSEVTEVTRLRVARLGSVAVIERSLDQ